MATEHPQAMPGDDGRYEVQRKLGEGSSGAVYLVRDRDTGEVLALKQLHRADDRSISRLKREFRSLANVHHRNVVRFYDLGRARDTWFVTMEYLTGTDLTQHLYKSPTTPRRSSSDASSSPIRGRSNESSPRSASSRTVCAPSTTPTSCIAT
jgi:eukaryotic-like serine/threonine-protein kinase